MSIEIMERWITFVPVGSGLCRHCRQHHKEILKGRMPVEGTVCSNTPILGFADLVQTDATNALPSNDSLQREKTNDNKETNLEIKTPTTENSASCQANLTQCFENLQLEDDPCPNISSRVSSSMLQLSLNETIESEEGEESIIYSPDISREEEWIATPQIKTKLSSLNGFIRSVSGRNVSPVRGQLHLPVTQISPSTSRYYKRKSKQVCKTVLDCITPGQSESLFELMADKKITDTSIPTSTGSDLVQRLITLYEESNSWITRQEILSIFVQDFSKAELSKMIPGLTKWRIDEARRHAALAGPGQPKEMPEIHRTRMDPVKVDHFVDFIVSPYYLQDVAYGTKVLKLSNKQTLEIPNVVRTVTASRLVDLYTSFCKEEDFIPLGRSTLFNILKVCAASEKKSLAGLDNTTTEGITAIQTLHDVAETLSRTGMPIKWAKDIQEKLKISKNYLKSDYKLHITDESRGADHCRAHALSDVLPEFQKKCLHEHDVVCDRCDAIESSLTEIEVAMSSEKVQLRSEQREEISHDIEKAVKKVRDWKAHAMRTAHQEAAKTTILNRMKPTQVLIIMDWAMKYLPVRFRETQAEWYGKKGRPWHVSAAITQNDEKEFEVKTFVHVFDQCVQNWFAVASIIEDLLQQIKQLHPVIDEAFLRSDNAGCYHCGPLMLAIPGISKRVGIQIRRYDFSDPQSGKDICDRRIATMKGHMRRFLNEGNDINSASDMKKALDSYGGVKGCRVSVVSVDTSKQEITQHKWTGIQSFRLGIKVWKAYAIGKRKLIRTQELKKMSKPQGKTGLIVQEKFSSPAVTSGALKKSKEKHGKNNETTTESAADDDQQLLQKGFACPEMGCVKVFVSSRALGNHLDAGKHFYRVHKEGAYDAIKLKWASTCLTISKVKGSTSQEYGKIATGRQQSKQLSTQDSERGWALKKAKVGVRFSKPVKEFLSEIFLKGEETGLKADPSEVSTRLRNMRNADGKRKMFQRSEWLTTHQNAGYFSRLSVLQKSGRVVENEEEEEEDEEVNIIKEVLHRQRVAENIAINLEP